MSGEARVEARKVEVVRGGRAILDLDRLEVLPSEILAVVGPNGAGKSTLIQVLALLLRPDKGEVRITGEIVRPGREHAFRYRLACVFQSPLLLDRTLRGNVELGLELRGVDPAERRRRLDRWLPLLGLDGLEERRVRTLSGGEAQRVNLARALVLAPEVLFLDEPLGGLDAPTRHSLMDELGPLVRDGAGAGLLVTHDRRVALALGDRVAVMLDGRVRQIGPPEDVFMRPVDLDVAHFVGVENRVPAAADSGQVKLEGGCVLRRASEQPAGDVCVCLRAEEVHLGEVPGENSGWNRLQGTVTRIVNRGDGFLAEVDVGCRLLGRLTRAHQAVLSLAPGDTVDLCIRPEAVHCVPR
ncbi:MAG: ABC transporter ATP-binding protein [Deltaproteobacteria bacterium]|nr:ABC transporter ATP-binding protein [Deltaproteobacteria bacterium]